MLSESNPIFPAQNIYIYTPHNQFFYIFEMRKYENESEKPCRTYQVCSAIHVSM